MVIVKNASHSWEVIGLIYHPRLLAKIYGLSSWSFKKALKVLEIEYNFDPDVETIPAVLL